MFPEAKAWEFDELRLGMTAEFTRSVTEEDVLSYARISGDFNPLHVDRDYARTTAFQRRIVHGAFQVGLASAMIGMHLPGRRVLLADIHARFPSPLHFPCDVVVTGEVASWSPDSRTGSLRVVVRECVSRLPTAEISLGFLFHERQEAEVSVIPAALPAGASDEKIVAVTGAAGGLGTFLVRELAREYRVLALVHRSRLDASLHGIPAITEVQVDIASPEVAAIITSALGGRTLYGIVHAAWPGAPHGGLLQADEEALKLQLEFGTKHLIKLANILAANVAKEGGRLVAVGSTAGSDKPLVHLSTYSLGKAAMEHTVRLLATELARRRITVNAVCPSLVPVGINKGINRHQQLREAAAIPMGRLCQPEDVLGAIRFLLIPENQFISGQSIKLTGAQL